MMCAAWERYNEDLLIEGINILANHFLDPNYLPKSIKQTISAKVKVDKHELKPLGLAGDGWKNLWRSYAEQETEKLNTPNSSNLNDLFKKYLGIESYVGYWISKNEINEFIKMRGEIAHKGSQAPYIQMRTLKKYIEMIRSNAIEIDRRFGNYLQGLTSSADPPWQLLYPKTLEIYKNEPTKFAGPIVP